MVRQRHHFSDFLEFSYARNVRLCLWQGIGRRGAILQLVCGKHGVYIPYRLYSGSSYQNNGCGLRLCRKHLLKKPMEPAWLYCSGHRPGVKSAFYAEHVDIKNFSAVQAPKDASKDKIDAHYGKHSVWLNLQTHEHFDLRHLLHSDIRNLWAYSLGRSHSLQMQRDSYSGRWRLENCGRRW